MAALSARKQKSPIHRRAGEAGRPKRDNLPCIAAVRLPLPFEPYRDSLLISPRVEGTTIDISIWIGYIGLRYIDMRTYLITVRNGNRFSPPGRL